MNDRISKIINIGDTVKYLGNFRFDVNGAKFELDKWGDCCAGIENEEVLLRNLAVNQPMIVTNVDDAGECVSIIGEYAQIDIEGEYTSGSGYGGYLVYFELSKVQV
ncbi:hypothetical protein RyT2_14230 [Pseudolactococcus yaeyamensis]